MIERHVYFRFTPEHSLRGALAEVIDRSRKLVEIPQVREVRVGQPADAQSRDAWDMVLMLTFDSIEDVAVYVDHPLHRAYVDEVIKPRLAVKKHWNFEV